MRACRASFWVAALVSVGPVGTLSAQPDRKPPPPPPQAVEPTVSKAQFVEAYKRSGRPLVAMVDFIVTDGRAPRADEMTSVMLFGARTREPFRDREISMLADDLLVKLRENTTIQALMRTDPRQAARVIADESKADLVVTLVLVPQGPRDDHAQFLGNYQVIDSRRNEVVAEWAWELSPYNGRAMLDAQRWSYYADAIAEDIMTKYVKYYGAEGDAGQPATPAPAAAPVITTTPSVTVTTPPGATSTTTVVTTTTVAAPTGGPPLAPTLRYGLRFTGDFDFADTQTLSAVLSATRGMDDVTLRKAGGDDDEYGAEYQVRFAGKLDALTYALGSAVWAEFGKYARIADYSQGNATVRIEKLPASRSPWIGPARDSNGPARQALAKAYEEAGRPRIAVLVTRVVGDDYDWHYWDRFVLLSGKHAIKDDKEIRTKIDNSQARAAAATVVAGAVYKRLSDLGLQCADQDEVTKVIERTGERAGAVTGDQELAALVKTEIGVPIVVTGEGSFYKNTTPSTATFTMRAHSTQDGSILTATNPATRTLPSTPNAIDVAAPKIADELAADLVDGFLKKWAGQKRLQVMVTGVASPSDREAARDAIGKLPGVKSLVLTEMESNAKEGMVRFDVWYDGDVDPVIRGLQGWPGVPFEVFTISGNRERVALRLVRQ